MCTRSPAAIAVAAARQEGRLVMGYSGDGVAAWGVWTGPLVIHFDLVSSVHAPRPTDHSTRISQFESN